MEITGNVHRKGRTRCYGLNRVTPSSYVEALNFSVMDFGNGALGLGN